MKWNRRSSGKLSHFFVWTICEDRYEQIHIVADMCDLITRGRLCLGWNETDMNGFIWNLFHHFLCRSCFFFLRKNSDFAFCLHIPFLLYSISFSPDLTFRKLKDEMIYLYVNKSLFKCVMIYFYVNDRGKSSHPDLI